MAVRLLNVAVMKSRSPTTAVQGYVQLQAIFRSRRRAGSYVQQWEIGCCPGPSLTRRYRDYNSASGRYGLATTSKSFKPLRASSCGLSSVEACARVNFVLVPSHVLSFKYVAAHCSLSWVMFPITYATLHVGLCDGS